MPREKGAMLLNKRLRSMVLGLGTNVFPHVIKLRLAYRECRISILPCEINHLRKCRLQPV